jgi:hypothetical protein
LLDDVDGDDVKKRYEVSLMKQAGINSAKRVLSTVQDIDEVPLTTLIHMLSSRMFSLRLTI